MSNKYLNEANTGKGKFSRPKREHKERTCMKKMYQLKNKKVSKHYQSEWYLFKNILHIFGTIKEEKIGAIVCEVV